MIELRVACSVRQVVTITPRNVRLFGTAGKPLQQTVAIVPEEQFPFKIMKTAARDGRNIDYRLREEQNGSRVVYRLTVKNRKADQGSYNDRIELTTDSRYKPRLYINVHGRIGAAGPAKKK